MKSSVLSLALLAMFTLTSSLQADLIVTELMYNAPTSVGADDEFEYIVVQNTSGGALDIQGYTFDDIADSDGSDGADAYTITSSTVISAGGYAILSLTSQASFEMGYGVTVPSNAVYIDTATLVDAGGTDNGQDGADGDSLPAFNNGGDDVNIFDDMGQVLVSFTYNDDDFPTTDGDGDALLIAADGSSIGAGAPLSTVAIPEPTSALILAVAGLAVVRRRR